MAATNDYNPGLTIVIATFNGFARVNAVLDSLEQQRDHDRSLDVIVVNDGSTQDPSLLNLDRKYPTQLISSSANLGGTAAKNIGAIASSGEYVLFLDDDIRLDPDCIRNFCQAIRLFPDDLLTGSLNRVTSSDTVFARCSRKSEESPLSGRGFDTVETLHEQCLGGFLVISKKNFLSLGMFEGLTEKYPNWEDVILGCKAKRAGLNVSLVSSAVGRHYDRSLESLENTLGYWREASYHVPDLILAYPDVKLPFIQDKVPISWSRDSFSLVVKKTIRRITAATIVVGLMSGAIWVLERSYRDCRLLSVLYRAVIGAAMYQSYHLRLSERGKQAGKSKPRSLKHPAMEESEERNND
jgi:GT2 family glycosyltransferase